MTQELQTRQCVLLLVLACLDVLCLDFRICARLIHDVVERFENVVGDSVTMCMSESVLALLLTLWRP